MLVILIVVHWFLISTHIPVVKQWHQFIWSIANTFRTEDFRLLYPSIHKVTKYFWPPAIHLADSVFCIDSPFCLMLLQSSNLSWPAASHLNGPNFLTNTISIISGVLYMYIHLLWIPICYLLILSFAVLSHDPHPGSGPELTICSHLGQYICFFIIQWLGNHGVIQTKNS